MHQNNLPQQPFTISPIIGLASDDDGICHFHSGQRVIFRITTLSDKLSDELPEWLDGLWELGKLDLDGTVWQIEKIAIYSDEHPWAGFVPYQNIIQTVRMEKRRSWTLEFITPMTFHGDHYYPFPQPENLVKSWLDRWNCFSPVVLPENLPEIARRSLMIEKYNLKTVPVRMHGIVFPGCIGQVTLAFDKSLEEELKNSINILVFYSFFCGSGYKTTQGLGQTRIIFGV